MSDSSTEVDFNYRPFLQQLTSKPGVYQMLDNTGKVIYVGKAKNLKNRVSSYFLKADHAVKTQVMVKQIANIAITVTNTETEALILENNLIKEFRPRYNVLFRDDKTYPNVYLSAGKYPRLAYHRGAKKKKGDYFGPFPSSGAVRQSLTLLQKLFKVRQCEDSVFKNRSRPCLQYQINRCTAPCVGYISEQDYAKDVEMTRLFYQGKSQHVIDSLSEHMMKASDAMEYEKAAGYRDQIVALQEVVQKQVISGVEIDLDVFACEFKAGMLAVVVMFVRSGQIMGVKHYYPKVSSVNSLEQSIESFIIQFYLSGREVPSEVIVAEPNLDRDLLAAGLSQIAKRKVKLQSSVRSSRSDWLKLAQQNAKQSLQAKINLQTNQKAKVELLKDQLNLSSLPNHMECFDISHTMGEGTVASCVVFKAGVPDKKNYRRFNIKDVKAGDDYAAIEQAVYRRYSRLLKDEAMLPDLILIDGGKGQLKSAQKALTELGLTEIEFISVAKGTERKLGMEQIFFPGESVAKILDADSAALHLVQHIRDESHRFAIAGHRAQRNKARTQSWLEEITGVGPKKRQALLKSFGGLQGVERATLADLKKVAGINNELAEKVYYFLREKD
ncbi:MAG: excinuclease ABC subunit UvrC [Kangiellaceae bacterium]|jgi:excinuclease ABC subunit C|nr:excinuclease ABC subunit UvrC [Kangiellaceae bacterium]